MLTTFTLDPAMIAALEPPDLALLVTLILEQDRNGVTAVPVTTLAEGLGRTATTVYRGLKSLWELGVISPVRKAQWLVPASVGYRIFPEGK